MKLGHGLLLEYSCKSVQHKNLQPKKWRQKICLILFSKFLHLNSNPNSEKEVNSVEKTEPPCFNLSSRWKAMCVLSLSLSSLNIKISTTLLWAVSSTSQGRMFSFFSHSYLLSSHILVCYYYLILTFHFLTHFSSYHSMFASLKLQNRL